MLSAICGFIVGVSIGYVIAQLKAQQEAASAETALRVIARRMLDKGAVELELSDGRLFRAEHGYVWREFPSGERTTLSYWLQQESERLRKLDEWTRGMP